MSSPKDVRAFKDEERHQTRNNTNPDNSGQEYIIDNYNKIKNNRIKEKGKP